MNLTYFGLFGGARCAQTHARQMVCSFFKKNWSPLLTMNKLGLPLFGSLSLITFGLGKLICTRRGVPQHPLTHTNRDVANTAILLEGRPGEGRLTRAKEPIGNNVSTITEPGYWSRYEARSLPRRTCTWALEPRPTLSTLGDSANQASSCTTPFEVDGTTVLVNRGWVSHRNTGFQHGVSEHPEEMLLMRAFPEVPGSFTPENTAEKVHWAEFSALNQAVGLPLDTPVFDAVMRQERRQGIGY